jgi:NAD(P)-dependent dehydrogenase (short-subunit alcohol dehydrogenase family)
MEIHHMPTDKRVALITGANRGIGFETARQLGQKGVTVIVAARTLQSAEGPASKLTKEGLDAFPLKLDVTNAQDREAAAKNITDKFRKLDILVNNAGVLDGYATCLDTSLELFDDVLAINLRGVFFGCKRALAEMVPAGAGKIVNIASVAGLVAMGGGFTYTISKHAVVGLTRQLACEYGPSGVRVNAICPGTIATNLRQTSMEILGDEAPDMANVGIGASSPDRIRQIVPLGARGTAEDIANAAVFLASAESNYMNGHMLVVDGGWTAH